MNCSVPGQCHLPVVNSIYCIKCLSQKKCPDCRRYLQDGLYSDDCNKIICNSCLRKIQAGRGRSSKTSVNRTFVTEELNVPTDIIDPASFIRQQESAIGDSLRTALLTQK